MPPASETRHTCVWCEGPLQGKRRHALYCSPRCRVYASRKRNKRAAPESVTTGEESVIPLPVGNNGTEEIPVTPALEASPAPSVGDPTADLLLDALRMAGRAGLTEEAFAKHCSPQITATARYQALTLLQRRGLARIVQEQTAERLLRTVWRVL